jgi:integrase
MDSECDGEWPTARNGSRQYRQRLLKRARELAAAYRSQVADGLAPILERHRIRGALARSDTSFHTLAAETFEARKAELKADGKAGQWFSPLAVHVAPAMGKAPVETIDRNMIRQVLAPIWHTKADAARKALNRISIVLRHAAAKGLDVDLQATAKARELLGRSRQEPRNIPAMDWRYVPDFYASLSDLTVTHLALGLLILTGVKSGPLRQIRLEQIDGDV